VKFHLAAQGAHNVFTGYGPGYVAVNNVRYARHVLVTATEVTDWNITDFAALNAAHFEYLRTLNPEILILGTGERLQFPAPALSRTLTAAGVGLEIMDSRAACRTYNIVAAEGRNVIAAILVA